MKSTYAEVDILVNGNPVKTFAHQGKLFVQSNHQVEYSIRIKNPTWYRRLFVVTVDGINVINGQAGGASKMGYIINGYSTYEVKGFRTDNDSVAPFKFSSKSRSYAAKSDETQGDTRNCGVIGIEVYNEQYKPRNFVLQPFRDYSSSDVINLYSFSGCPPNPWTNQMSNLRYAGTSTASSPMEQDRCVISSYCCSIAQEQPKAAFDMGTEFSDYQVRDSVTEVDFDIGYLAETITVYYASRSGLIDMGVPVTKETHINTFPNAFPTKFCMPPRR